MFEKSFTEPKSQFIFLQSLFYHFKWKGTGPGDHHIRRVNFSLRQFFQCMAFVRLDNEIVHLVHVIIPKTDLRFRCRHRCNKTEIIAFRKLQTDRQLMMIQKITTKEPYDEQLEVAIKALKAVI